MKKKILNILLVLVTLLTLSSCERDNAQGGSEGARETLFLSISSPLNPMSGPMFSPTLNTFSLLESAVHTVRVIAFDTYKNGDVILDINQLFTYTEDLNLTKNIELEVKRVGSANNILRKDIYIIANESTELGGILAQINNPSALLQTQYNMSEYFVDNSFGFSYNDNGTLPDRAEAIFKKGLLMYSSVAITDGYTNVIPVSLKRTMARFDIRFSSPVATAEFSDQATLTYNAPSRGILFADNNKNLISSYKAPYDITTTTPINIDISNGAYKNIYSLYVPAVRLGTSEEESLKFNFNNVTIGGATSPTLPVSLNFLTRINSSEGESNLSAIEPNIAYELDLEIKREEIVFTSLNIADRVETELTTDIVDVSDAPANCYIVEAGQTLKFSSRRIGVVPLDAAGNPINGSEFDYFGRSEVVYDAESGKHFAQVESQYSISKVEVVWQSAHGLEDVSPNVPVMLTESISIDTVKEEVTIKTTVGAGGNLVIKGMVPAEGWGPGVYFTQWTWHIWVVDEGEVKEQALNTVADAYMLDRALGALTPNGMRGYYTYGLVYQFGRKDPFPSPYESPYDVGSNKFGYQLYKADGTPHPKETKDGEGGFFYNVPYQSLNEASYGSLSLASNWYAVYQSATADLSVMSFGWSKNQKTLYDPCPYGYRVPKRDVWGYDSSLSGDNLSESAWDVPTDGSNLLNRGKPTAGIFFEGVTPASFCAASGLRHPYSRYYQKPGAAGVLGYAGLYYSVNYWTAEAEQGFGSFLPQTGKAWSILISDNTGNTEAGSQNSATSKVRRAQLHEVLDGYQVRCVRYSEDRYIDK